MKKISLLLVGLLAMFSCEQEDLEGIVKSGAGQVQTRTATSIADFNPIYELDGIPVNILNVENTSRRYLSCAESGNKIDLFTEDDGSLRQRWYLTYNNIISVGGNKSYSSSYDSSSELVVVCFKYPDNIVDPSLGIVLKSPSSTFVTGFYSFTSASGNYYNIIASDKSMQFPPNNQYLQSDTRSGATLKNKSSASSDLALWEIVPVGEFRLVDVQYEKVVNAGDFINQRDISLQGAVFPSLPNDVEHTITVSETIRESSTFTETSGVTTQNQSSFNLGVQAGEAPLPMINIGGSISSSTTSSRTRSYAETGGYDVTVSQTFKVLIPANTACTVEVLKMAYNTSLTYVATFEKRDGAGSGKRFRIKGKWDGIVSTFLYYNIYRTEDNKLIGTRVVE